jgi:GNAT superfamily N-acetyltransferase
MEVRKATAQDISAIKAIADANKQELGFVTRPALLFGIQKGWLLVAQCESGIVGFVHYRHRRDAQTTLYELCVEREHRDRGIGRLLIEALVDEARAQGKSYILLKAVVGIPANGFYEHIGFVLDRKEQGKKRALNAWKLLC